jgi:hypothetical protein
VPIIGPFPFIKADPTYRYQLAAPPYWKKKTQLPEKKNEYMVCVNRKLPVKAETEFCKNVTTASYYGEILAKCGQ